MLRELNLSTPERFVFLQETDSSVDDKTNLCGVAIGYYGKKVFQTSEQIY